MTTNSASCMANICSSHAQQHGRTVVTACLAPPSLLPTGTSNVATTLLQLHLQPFVIILWRRALLDSTASSRLLLHQGPGHNGNTFGLPDRWWPGMEMHRPLRRRANVAAD